MTETFDPTKFTFVRPAEVHTFLVMPGMERTPILAWGWYEKLPGLFPLSASVNHQNKVVERLTHFQQLQIEHPCGTSEKIG